MIWVFVILFFVFVYIIGMWVYKVFRYFFVSKNPYILHHKVVDHNEKNYDDYLKWLDKKGGGLPVDKIKTAEEKNFEKQYSKHSY